MGKESFGLDQMTGIAQAVLNPYIALAVSLSTGLMLFVPTLTHALGIYEFVNTNRGIFFIAFSIASTVYVLKFIIVQFGNKLISSAFSHMKSPKTTFGDSEYNSETRSKFIDKPRIAFDFNPLWEFVCAIVVFIWIVIRTILLILLWPFLTIIDSILMQINKDKFLSKLASQSVDIRAMILLTVIILQDKQLFRVNKIRNFAWDMCRILATRYGIGKLSLVKDNYVMTFLRSNAAVVFRKLDIFGFYCQSAILEFADGFGIKMQVVEALKVIYIQLNDLSINNSADNQRIEKYNENLGMLAEIIKGEQFEEFELEVLIKSWIHFGLSNPHYQFSRTRPLLKANIEAQESTTLDVPKATQAQKQSELEN